MGLPENDTNHLLNSVRRRFVDQGDTYLTAAASKSARLVKKNNTSSFLTPFFSSSPRKNRLCMFSHRTLLSVVFVSTIASTLGAESPDVSSSALDAVISKDVDGALKESASASLLIFNKSDSNDSNISTALQSSPLLITGSLLPLIDDLPEEEAIESLPTPQPHFLSNRALIRGKRVDDNPIDGDEIKIDGSDEDLSTEQSAPSIVASMPTVTVRGFLNFRTTVDGTVIVFTPSSAAPSSSSSVYFGDVSTPSSSVIKSTMTPEYPFAAYKSRETTGLSNIASRWSSYTAQQSRPDIQATPTSNQQVYPTGIVSLLSDTLEGDDGKTTVQETKIIGTYIEGKYAQILKSSSFLKDSVTPIIPTGTVKVASFFSSSSHTLPHSSTVSNNGNSNRHEIRKPALTQSSNFRPPKTDRHTRLIKNNLSNGSNAETREDPTVNTDDVGHSSRARRPGRHWNRPATERVNRLNRFKIKVNLQEVSLNASSSASSSPHASQSSRFTARDESDKEAAKLLNQRLNRRLGVTRGLHLSSKQEVNHDKKSEKKSEWPANQPVMEGLLTESSNDKDDEEHVIQPSRRVVSHIQTYLSQVTRGFEGGQPLIETITLTTAIERTLDASEDALSPHPLTSVPHLFLPSIEATPPIVVSKTYTVTESSVRTSLVSASEGSLSTTMTLTENLVMTKTITALKTLPAEMGSKFTSVFNSILDEMNQSDYADNLISSESSSNNGFQGGLFQGNLDLLTITPTSPSMMIHMMSSTETLTSLEPSLNPLNLNGLISNNKSPFGPQIDLNNPLVVGAALQNPNLAAMYFGLQQLSQQATQYSTVIKSTQVTSTETVYATKTLSFYDGRQTRTRTITEAASTTIRVIPTTMQEVQPVINPQVLVQQAQLQRAFASQLLHSQASDHSSVSSFIPNFFVSPPPPGQNPFNNPSLPAHLTPLQNALLLQQQQQGSQQQRDNIVTTESVTTVTTATETSTKVYTLIYNALSTKFRTVTSTSIFPTTVTQVVTKTVTQSPNNAFNIFG